MRTFVKTAHGADLLGEAAALRWLAEASASGGIRVAGVVRASATALEEERIEQGLPSPSSARAAGAALAHTHAAGAPWFGAPPPGWDGPGYVIADTLTPVIANDDPDSTTWGASYARRLETYAGPACELGVLGPGDKSLVTSVCERLRAGELDHPQPELVRAGGAAAARLHGDLWAGNLLTDAVTGEAVVIDPMAHGGHAETDLAMLSLFGYPCLDEFLAGYEEASPLAPGWRNRVSLHQLAPLLHHCLLYGHGYVAATRHALQATLALPRQS